MIPTEPLDRPIWAALTGPQSALALVGPAAARRFPAEVSPFAATGSDDPATLTGLAALVAPGDTIVLLQAGPIPVPPGLDDELRADGVQMVASSLAGPGLRTAGPAIVDLGDGDAADMVALAALTRPGPFRERTNTLGGFVGIRDGDGRLVAMAGERLALDGHVEVSGVCTHPDARGRGYAGILSTVVASRILDRGAVPFLHAFTGNRTAIDLYRRLGFEVRREMTVAAFARPTPAGPTPG